MFTPVDNPPDYMVVNLASNAVANSETYYPAVEFLPGGLLKNSDYRMSKIVMRKIPSKGVEWTMGSVEGEFGYDKTREAWHTVTMTNNYYIAVFETTQAQWAQIQTASGRTSFFGVESLMRPVERVSYNDIRSAETDNTSADAVYNYPRDPNPKSFLGRLRTKTGLAFDLPSEAQWEFACRAGHGAGYWGNGSSIDNSGNDTHLADLGRFQYNGGMVLNSEKKYVDPGTSSGVTNGTAIVGSYTPNSWGLYDMHGNVQEWCLDWYEENITARSGAVNVDPSEPANTLSGVAGTSRVCRGGSWQKEASRCRAARRDYSPSSYRNNSAGTYGFRLVLSVK